MKDLDFRIEVLESYLVNSCYYTSEELKELKEKGYIYQSEWDKNAIEVNGVEYYVLTDEEADTYTKKEIESTLWKFTSRFLSHTTGLEELVFDSLYKDLKDNDTVRCAYRAIINLTCGIDEFVKKAVLAEGRGGRGSYLSYANGIEVKQGDYFIYKIN